MHNVMDIDQEKLIKLLDDMDVPIVPILITAAGLPNSHKTTTVDEFFKQYELSPTDVPAYPPLEHAGIKWYELVAMWNKLKPTSGLLSPKYKYTCYLYAMYCGLSQKYQSKKQEIKFEDESTPKSLVFPDDKLLEGGLNNIFQELQEFHTQTSDDDKQKLRENFQRVLPKGVAFMNIWNIKLSKAVFYFLPLLSGQLSHDYLWLFFDLERDAKSMHLPPEVPDTYFDHDVLMIWRSRLYYMLRHVYFTTGSNITGESRCLMLPVCNKMSTTSDHLLEQCKKQMIDLAREMKIEHLIDLEKEMHILSLDTNLSDRNGQLRNKADELLMKGFKSPTMVPLSHIFLRNCLYISDSLYIEKEVLQNIAKKLEMDDNSFEKFCKFFNSGGSIIDASLLGSQSPYIILKPIHFFSKLDQIFNYDKNELVTLFGLFSLSVAEDLLDTNTKFFMNVLSSAGLSIELSYERILLPSDFQEMATPPLYYIPIAGRKHNRKDCKPTALHLQITGQVLNRNIQVAFTKEFLNLNSTAKLNFKSPASREMNCSSFDFEGTQFDIVCHGNEAEFILPDMCTNEAIYKAIADSCYNVLTQLINSDVFFCFSFSFICCQKEKVEFKFERERHLLPYSVVGRCDECDELMSTQKTMKIWNKYMKVCNNAYLYTHCDKKYNSQLIIIIILYRILNGNECSRMTDIK